MRPGPLSDGAVLSRRFWRRLPHRARILATRRVVWTEPETGEVVSDEREPWSLIWAMEGVHSHNWWWVYRWGRLPCGCLRNPLTRRMVAYQMFCEVHPR